MKEKYFEQGYYEEKYYWIWLSRIKKIGARKSKQLLKVFGTPEKIWYMKKEELLKVKGIGNETANEILKEEYRENLEQYIKYMNKYKIGLITIQDKDYPEKLKKIYDAPIVLYYKGDKELLKQKSIAIVGCRQCSEYGKDMALKFSYELAKKEICIISGMAKGIDAYSHIGTLNAGGKTIAILGCGVDKIYPKENEKLYYEILGKGGLIISEYIIGTKPDKMNFPARNRIISGLSDGILVIEAKKKSGTLITVDFALEQGKEIYVIPGNINSDNSIGTNELLKQGANFITCVEEIL